MIASLVGRVGHLEVCDGSDDARDDEDDLQIRSKSRQENPEQAESSACIEKEEGCKRECNVRYKKVEKVKKEEQGDGVGRESCLGGLTERINRMIQLL